MISPSSSQPRSFFLFPPHVLLRRDFETVAGWVAAAQGSPWQGFRSMCQVGSRRRLINLRKFFWDNSQKAFTSYVPVCWSSWHNDCSLQTNPLATFANGESFPANTGPFFASWSEAQVQLPSYHPHVLGAHNVYIFTETPTSIGEESFMEEKYVWKVTMDCNLFKSSK